MHQFSHINSPFFQIISIIGNISGHQLLSNSFESKMTKLPTVLVLYIIRQQNISFQPQIVPFSHIYPHILPIMNFRSYGEACIKISNPSPYLPSNINCLTSHGIVSHMDLATFFARTLQLHSQPLDGSKNFVPPQIYSQYSFLLQF